MDRKTIIRIISNSIVIGKGIKIDVDGHTLRLEYGTRKPYMIWHDETSGEVAAIIYEEGMNEQDYYSQWVLSK